MSLIGVLFVLILGSYSLFFYAQRPLVRAESEATAIAKEQAGIEKAMDFYWYNGGVDTYFTVGGYTNEEEYQYVVIKQNGGNTWTFSSQEIVTEEEAKSILLALKQPSDILEARIGMEKEEPFWEVAYQDGEGQLGYIIISARTGELIREFQDI